MVEIFLPLKNNLIKVDSTIHQKESALKVSIKRKAPKGDVLHALIARDNEAILITQDKHFRKLKDIVLVKKPEDF